MNKGMLYAAGAYVSWGLLPVYWKALDHVSATQILAHRIVWGLLVALLLVAQRGRWRWLADVFRSRRTMLTFAATSVLITVNWGVYIWAVNAGHIVEASLGYFINPLVNVLLGVVFLKERLRPWQGAAVAVALAGVLYLTVIYGSLPWVALILACSFGLYGLMRKTATLSSLEGFTVETLLLFIPALGYLIYEEVAGVGSLGHAAPLTTILLVGAGLVTAVPLIFFAEGARRLTLTTLGILQYISPTLQFLLGVLVYAEPLNVNRLIGFCLIWSALVIYTLESIAQNSRTVRHRPVAGEV